MELLLRFVIGGTVVSAFALFGDVFRPKTFAGLFAAAPSVALATLALAVVKDGEAFAAEEARSMLAGAIALAAYCHFTSWCTMRRGARSLAAAILGLPLWLAVAFTLHAFLPS